MYMHSMAEFLAKPSIDLHVVVTSMRILATTVAHSE